MVTLSFYLYGDQAAGPSPARHRSGKRGFKNASRCRRSRARARIERIVHEGRVEMRMRTELWEPKPGY
jgi:hypothetical protein